MVTEQGTKSVQEAVRLTDQTALAFRTVAEAVDSAHESAQQITYNVRQQTAAIDPVVEAMNPRMAEMKSGSAAAGAVRIDALHR